MAFEVGKEYRTRDGRRAVVLSDQYPVGMCGLVGVMETSLSTNEWELRGWTASGKRYINKDGDDEDLMPEPREWWIIPSTGQFSDEETAASNIPGIEVVHVREVL